MDSETVKCFGDNFEGKLGYEDTTQRGANPGEMGDYLFVLNVGGAVSELFCGGFLFVNFYALDFF